MSESLQLSMRFTKSERVIVSPIPGTTRDAVDVPFEVETEGVREKYVFVDTAGIRKTRKIDDSVEFFSVQRSEESIARCDIAILVLDAEAGILEQDKKIADHIVEEPPRLHFGREQMGFVRGKNPRETKRGNYLAREKGKSRRAKNHDHARRIRRVGAGKIIFSRLRAGDFHVRKIGFSSGSPAGSGSLCRRAVAAENSDGDFEPHVARFRRKAASRSLRKAIA